MVGLVVFIGTGEFVLVDSLPGAVFFIAADGLEEYRQVCQLRTLV